MRQVAGPEMWLRQAGAEGLPDVMLISLARQESEVCG
jgi:hypothetical protein